MLSNVPCSASKNPTNNRQTAKKGKEIEAAVKEIEEKIAIVGSRSNLT
jgi:hypothetical protein